MPRFVVRVTASVVVLLSFAFSAAFAQSPATAEADPPPGVVRIACVGDSITFGHTIPDRVRQCYPAQLGRLLGDGFAVRNYGVNGATALANGDRPYMKRPAFARAIAFKPDVVIVGLGTNDSKPQNWTKADAFSADCAAILAAFKAANPKARLYVALPAPAFERGEGGIRDRVLRDEIIPKLRQVAKDAGAQAIDLRTPLEGRAALFPDKIHPTAEGAGVIANAVAAAVRGG